MTPGRSEVTVLGVTAFRGGGSVGMEERASTMGKVGAAGAVVLIAVVSWWLC